MPFSSGPSVAVASACDKEGSSAMVIAVDSSAAGSVFSGIGKTSNMLVVGIPPGFLSSVEAEASCLASWEEGISITVS